MGVINIFSAWEDPPSRRDDLLTPQVIDHHVASETYPTPAKPHHLTFVSVDHGLPGPPVLEDVVDEDDSIGGFFLASCCALRSRPRIAQDRRVETFQHGRDGVQNETVLAQDVDRGQRVQGHGTGVARVSAHDLLQEKSRAVEQGLVVGVARDAVAVERDEDVDRCTRTFYL